MSAAGRAGTARRRSGRPSCTDSGTGRTGHAERPPRREGCGVAVFVWPFGVAGDAKKVGPDTSAPPTFFASTPAPAQRKGKSLRNRRSLTPNRLRDAKKTRGADAAGADHFASIDA